LNQFSSEDNSIDTHIHTQTSSNNPIVYLTSTQQNNINKNTENSELLFFDNKQKRDSTNTPQKANNIPIFTTRIPKYEKSEASARPLKEKSQKTYEEYSQLSSKIIKELLSNTYDCLICSDRIKRHVAIWSCTQCWQIFHLYCIKKWRNKSNERMFLSILSNVSLISLLLSLYIIIITIIFCFLIVFLYIYSYIHLYYHLTYFINRNVCCYCLCWIRRRVE
jgi:hypothetical protein